MVVIAVENQSVNAVRNQSVIKMNLQLMVVIAAVESAKFFDGRRNLLFERYRRHTNHHRRHHRRHRGRHRHQIAWCRHRLEKETERKAEEFISRHQLLSASGTMLGRAWLMFLDSGQTASVENLLGTPPDRRRSRERGYVHDHGVVVEYREQQRASVQMMTVSDQKITSSCKPL